jgi:hypothetical protein
MNPVIPFQTTDWSAIPCIIYKGETSEAHWRTLQFGGLRLRMVDYLPGYKADHWCAKGHIIYCIEGEMLTTLSDGNNHILRKGMTYQVSDNMSLHKSETINGAKLLIIDGDFLKKTD